MRIAVVGGGVSGLVAAHLLHRHHDVTLFEAADQLGGHTHTVDVELDGRTWAVDCGFIVYNETNYPLFTRLLRELDVATHETTMSFSVRMESPNLEYNGSTVPQLFVQPRNLLRPSHYRMIADILRFNRTAAATVGSRMDLTVRDFVDEGQYSRAFTARYLVPMSAALWSAPRSQVMDMPAQFLVRFLENHGMLTVNDRPQWRVVTGGSREYVRKLTAAFTGDVRCGHPVTSVQRHPDAVRVDGERFDECVLACHSDQALSLLDDPTEQEAAVLGAIPYQTNSIVMHTDPSALPRRRAAWAAWNYHTAGNDDAPVGVTYNMNILQGLDAPRPLCVTLNETAGIDPASILYQTEFDHPVFTTDGYRAQQQHGVISGVNRTHYCGAYWGNGFHEAGVRSAHAVADALAQVPA